MSLAERKWLRLATLVVLYVAQGIPWGFMATTIPAYLADRGLDAGAVGLALATTTLPYTFKWVWGPIIDAVTIPRFGRRRPWIVFAQFMMAMTVVAMLAIGDLSTDLKLLAWMILIHTVFNALQDVSVDALAVDLLDDDERGRANGLMYGAKYGGGAIGGIGLATVIAYTSLEIALLVQGVVLFAIMMVPLLVRESNTPPPPRTKPVELVRAFADVFASRSAAVMILVMLTSTFALGMVTSRAATMYTQDLGWSAQKYTALVGGWGLAAGGLSAAGAGFLADAIGARRLAMIASIGMGLGWLVFSLNEGRWENDAFIYATSIWETVCTASMSVSLFAVCMQVSSPAIGASQFAAYMALSNFGTTLGYRAAAETTSWSVVDVWQRAAAFQILAALVLLFVKPSQTRDELPRPDGHPSRVRGWIILGLLLLFLVRMTYYVVRPML